MGWVSAFENNGKIFEIKFSKVKKQQLSKICSKNKLLLLVPCHRVIKSDGSLGEFTSIGGINLKRKLLEFEQFWK